MRLAGLLACVCLSLLGAQARASAFSVRRSPSPFPSATIHPPFGAATMLTANISCANGGTRNLEIPTGADTSFISIPAAESGVNAPLYLSAEQDGVEPKTILVHFRYSEITAQGVIQAGGSARMNYPTPSCPGGVTVSLQDVVMPSQPAPQMPENSGLMPFPAEKN